jgi:spore germination cell wall hydrolase CwlJ-like protein
VKNSVKLSPKERECLAKNVYHEAGVEPLAGKIAVAQVTLNRTKSDRWSSDVCKVVMQKAQFSWTLQKKKLAEKPKGKLWEDSVKAVEKFEQGVRVAGVEKAHFYHTDYIKTPKWADKSQKVAVVGQHIFYKEDRKL